MFYALGSHPLFERLKSIKSIAIEPYFLFAITRMYGYIYSCCRKKKRSVTEAFVKFLRNEQYNKLKAVFIKGK